jgi:hypothetical protein
VAVPHTHFRAAPFPPQVQGGQELPAVLSDRDAGNVPVAHEGHPVEAVAYRVVPVGVGLPVDDPVPVGLDLDRLGPAVVCRRDEEVDAVVPDRFCGLKASADEFADEPVALDNLDGLRVQVSGHQRTPAAAPAGSCAARYLCREAFGMPVLALISP